MAKKKVVEQKTVEKKPVTPSVICDVLDGKYGFEAGKERNAALKADGINPSVVTKRLNELKKLTDKLRPIFDEAGEYAGCLMLMLDE